MNDLAAKLIAVLCIVMLAFTTGWKVKGAFVAKEELGIDKAKTEFVKSYRESESTQAAMLQATLDRLHANERVINNEVTKVITRDVYHNVCLDDAGLQLIERARTGKTNTSEPAK